MAKMLHNLINGIVDLGGGLRLQPRGTHGSIVPVTDEQAKLESVVKMSALRKIRVVSLDEHDQQKRAAKAAPAPKADPVPAPEPEQEKPKDEPKEEAKDEVAAPEPEASEPEASFFGSAPSAEDEDVSTKSSKSRKKKSRKKG